VRFERLGASAQGNGAARGNPTRNLSKPDCTPRSDGLAGGWRWRGFGGFGEATTTVDTYKVGTLVVDLFDAHSKTLIWRGSSSDTLSDKSEKNIENLDKGVQKMFDHFPPDVKN
jgi:hypothetical protein